jgi:uncharacterized membrane protein YphA (DoxX/SURF4 family)
MKQKSLIISRVFLGLVFLVFGLNGFLRFMPTPPVTPDAGALLGAFAKTGYFFPMIKVLEIVIGGLLLVNVFAPFAIVLLAPILIGITTIHLFLNPAGLSMMIVIHFLHGFVAYCYKDYYKGMLVLKAKID